MSPIPTCSLTCTGRSRSAASSPGSPTSRWPRLNRALDAPGISARHRARLLVLGARTYSSHGELEKAGQLATTALAGGDGGQRDNWAIAWALHVLTIVTTMQGQHGRRSAVVRPRARRDRGRSGPDRPAAAAADQHGHEPGQPWTGTRSVCARPGKASVLRASSVPSSGWRRRRPRWASCPSTPGDGTMFDTGRWDEAVAEVETAAWPEHAAACSDLGIAAVICFHRGDLAAARRHLAAAAAACRADRATA